MSETLLNFKLPVARKKLFQRNCRLMKTTMTAELNRFIAQWLVDHSDPRLQPVRLGSSAQAEIENGGRWRQREEYFQGDPDEDIS